MRMSNRRQPLHRGQRRLIVDMGGLLDNPRIDVADLAADHRLRYAGTERERDERVAKHMDMPLQPEPLENALEILKYPSLR